MKYLQHSHCPFLTEVLNERYGPEGVYKSFILHMIFKVNEDLIASDLGADKYIPFELKDSRLYQYNYFTAGGGKSVKQHAFDMEADALIKIERRPSSLLIYPSDDLLTLIYSRYEIYPKRGREEKA